MSKADMHGHKKGVLSVSTETGDGFSELSTKISTKIKEYYSKNKIRSEFLINQRQFEILTDCNNKMCSLLNDLGLGVNRDILADILHLVLDEYNNIISPVDRDDIINNIFAGFCIGK